VSMFVTLSSIYVLQNYWFRYYFAVIMTSYMTYGLFIDSWDYIIHHVFALSIIGFKLIFAIHDSRPDNTLVYFTRCEYSSIFYSGKIIVCDIIDRTNSKTIKKIEPIIKNAFDLAFLISFIKVRIYDLGKYVVFNPNSYSWHHEIIGNRTILYFVYNFSIWGFYALNLYWLMIITRKAYKSLVVKYNSHSICEYICQYSIFISYLVCSYVYTESKYTKVPALIDLGCISYLSYTSYKFHRFLYNELQTTCESFDSLKKGSRLMINDAIGINVCSFGSFVSTVWFYYPQSPNKVLGFVLFLLGFTVLFGWLTIQYIRDMKSSGEQLVFNKDNPKRTNLYVLINLPCLTAVILSILIEKDFRSYTELMILVANHSMCIWASTVLVKIVPFYRLNHIATHMIVAIHHYCIAKQIVSGSI